MKKRLMASIQLGLLAVALWVPSLRAQSASAPGTSNAAIIPASANLTINPGEKLVLQLDTPLHTRSTRDGDRAYFRTSDEVMAGGIIAIPRGSEVRATVTSVRRPGRLAGRAELRLRFDDVRLADGTILPLNASVVRAGFTKIKDSKDGDQTLKGEGGNGSSIAVLGQGGLQGAILGASIGGGKGAMYGGAAGAAIGLATVMLQRGPDLDLPRDMLFELKFDQAFQVPAAVAQKAVQLARSVPVVPSVSSGGSPLPPQNFPRDPSAEPVPDFSRDKDIESQTQPPEATTVDVASTTTTPPLAIPPSGTPGNPSPTVTDVEDADGFKLKVDVQLVMVDATVRDRSGRPMESLRKDDFRVFENGLEQTIQSFSRDEYPLAVALVVDRSGSVAPYMNELRRAAYRTLYQLKRGDQVCLFTFAGEVQRLEDLTTDRQRIADRIGTIRAGGGTNIVDGLFDAVYYLSLVARDRRRVVILVSDNENTTRPRSSQNEVIRMAMESETVIYSVKTAGEGMPLTMRVPVWVGGLGKEDMVGKITRETGGEVIDVGSAGSLDSALATVITRLKLRYTLGYNSPNAAKDGTFRKIDVRLSERYGRPDSDYSVSARRGYYSPVERVAQANP
ncbi:MAG: VWA domain-containing protein [Acidobacteria bacterium]|nr:VWA domain-containing protein [Acidobacteriota bacterium]MCI0723517.1 VWA domain-containing protein [Acidobacteriota bacterium]